MKIMCSPKKLHWRTHESCKKQGQHLAAPHSCHNCLPSSSSSYSSFMNVSPSCHFSFQSEFNLKLTCYIFRRWLRRGPPFSPLPHVCSVVAVGSRLDFIKNVFMLALSFYFSVDFTSRCFSEQFNLTMERQPHPWHFRFCAYRHARAHPEFIPLLTPLPLSDGLF